MQSPVVLVVEDDVLARSSIVEHLYEAGWGVIVTADAPEAMDVIASGARIDVVFADFKLPGGPTGYMLAQWLEARMPTLPVLLTSGLTSAQPGFIRGMFRRFIAKPYALADVSRLLSEMVKPG